MTKNAYRFDIIVTTDIEMNDKLLVELSIEMRDAFISVLKAKRIGGKLNGDCSVTKCEGVCDKWTVGGHT